jgi:eukaryotic-like serine/threonine-protein kinase
MAALDGSASAALQDVWRGTTVGKYELLTQLSSGGMAELFLGYTPGPGGFRKYVVIKRILPEARDNEQFMKMFLDEARITAAFSHPNIAQVFDLGDDQDGLYLAMEFIGGQNLNQVTNGCARARAVMPLGFSASVVHDCALALHYAHTFKDPAGKDYPVIHRDVAQKNIMVTYEGMVKLLDFGIAKARGTLGKTHAGAVKGTAGYMSPEQVRGEPLDGRSDVFALGVVLYEMITGRRLFSGATETEEMRMILEAPIARPSEVLAVIPEELSDVAMRALARTKSDRFASAKEMSRALSSACGHLLFDQEQRAVFMRELFEEKMLATQQLLESAGAELDRGSLLEQAAQAMRDDAGQSAAAQQVAKKLPPKQLAAAKKKKVKKEAAKQVDEDLDQIKAKATAMAAAEEVKAAAAAPPPVKEGGGGLVVPLLLVVALAAGGFGIFKIVGGEEAQPDVGAYKADVPIPEYGQTPEPVKVQAVVDTSGTDKDKDDKGDKGDKKPSGGKGSLTLFTIPAGAKVTLKGKEVGKTPLLNQSLPAGTHLLLLAFPDGKKKQLSAQIEAGKTAKFKFKEDELPDG